MAITLGGAFLPAFDAARDPINPLRAAPWPSSLDPAQSCGGFWGQGPARQRRRVGQGSGELGGETVQDGAVTAAVALR